MAKIVPFRAKEVRDPDWFPPEEANRIQSEPLRMCGGTVLSKGHSHRCDPPGKWHRWLHNLRYDAKWRCDCGKHWTLLQYWIEA